MLTKKNPDTSNLAKKAGNLAKKAKISEIENKIPSVTGLATNSALTAVENKIPDVTSLVKKKTDHNAKSLIVIKINTLLLQNLIS